MIDMNHPRAQSLRIRDKVVQGVEKGITSLHGLVAQGRGEAFDYLIGEQTNDFAEHALEAAAALLLQAEYPVLSVNGNSAALCAEEYVFLAEILDCPIEVNLFHRTVERENLIKAYLVKYGGNTIVGVGKDASEKISGIASERKFVSPYGIKKADVVFVPLEDGDRCEALINEGKKVITIDLNPFSRTSQHATITVVDNIVRAFPRLITHVKELQRSHKEILQQKVSAFKNRICLQQAKLEIYSRLHQ